MNEIIEKENFTIEDMIYEIRGVQVMLDSDIAELYQVETKRINEAVKNNPEKFPERYTFRIAEYEFRELRSKISTSKGGSRKGHTVFTEQGLYMLATILKSKVAINVTIAIMDTFVKMRHYINYNNDFLPHKFMLLENKVDDNTKRINELFDKFDPKVIVKDYIYFEGDFYDSYINNNFFHERFFIMDKKILYSCGASFKDLGKKCFAINKIETEIFLEKILETIEV